MIVVDAEMYWSGQGMYANQFPQILLTVDKMPEFSDLIYEAKEADGGTAYYGETEDGYVSFIHHSPKAETGFGGCVFQVPTKDGVVAVKGPWSSRPGAMNELGFGPCVDVYIRQTKSDYIDLTYSGNITVELAEKVVAQFMPDFTLTPVFTAYQGVKREKVWQLHRVDEDVMDIPHFANYHERVEDVSATS